MLENLFHSVPNNPINSKNIGEKNNLRRSQYGGWGSEGGMSMLTDSMVFFGRLPFKRIIKDRMSMIQLYLFFLFISSNSFH